MFGFGEDDLPDFLYACAHVAALRYARRAQPDEFYIRSVSSGLRASPYLEPIPATPWNTRCSIALFVTEYNIK